MVIRSLVCLFGFLLVGFATAEPATKPSNEPRPESVTFHADPESGRAYALQGKRSFWLTFKSDDSLRGGDFYYEDGKRVATEDQVLVSKLLSSEAWEKNRFTSLDVATRYAARTDFLHAPDRETGGRKMATALALGVSREQRGLGRLEPHGAVLVERFRELLNTPDEREAFDREFTRGMVPTGRIEPCSEICKPFQPGNYAKWGGVSKNEYQNWAFPIKALQALYSLKVAPYCHLNPGFMENLENAVLEWGTALSARDPERITADVPVTYYVSYGQAFSLMIWRELEEPRTRMFLRSEVLQRVSGHAASEGKRKQYNRFSESKAALIEHLEKMIGIEPLPGKGSDLTTHAYATGLLALPADDGQTALRKVEDIIAKWKERNSYGGEFTMPYHLNGRYSGETDGESAPRTLLIRLVQHIYQPTRQTRSALHDAVFNFVMHSGQLINTITYPGTHLNARRQMAPYYYYPTIPFAMAAAVNLVETAKNANERNSAQTLQIWLERGLKSLITHYGFTALNLKNYPDNPTWSIPLAGLAIYTITPSCLLNGQRIENRPAGTNLLPFLPTK